MNECESAQRALFLIRDDFLDLLVETRHIVESGKAVIVLVHGEYLSLRKAVPAAVKIFVFIYIIKIHRSLYTSLCTLKACKK